LYSKGMGRPSFPPEVLFRMLFLEFCHNLSDVEASKQCRYNLLYRVFVGLGIDDPTPDDTTLVVFRKFASCRRIFTFQKQHQRR
jgi:transposase